MIDFGTTVAQHLERIGMSQRAFARRVAASPSLVQKVVSNERLPPLRRLDAWLRALSLTDAQQEDLRWLAHLAHASPWLRERVVQLLERTGKKLGD